MSTAEQQALELFAAGASVAAVKEALTERGLPGREVRRALDAALAELVESLEVGPIEAWLDEASRTDLRTMSQAQRRQHEKKVGQVWQLFDRLMDDEVRPSDLIKTAKQLDKLLPELAWAKKLPVGAFG